FEHGDLDEALQDYQRARTLARSLRSKDLPQIESAIDALVERQKVERQLSRLKARLKQDPDNQGLARKLIEWLVVRLDAPLEARKYTFLVDDPKLRQRVAWAAMPADQRTADQSYALGMWYEQLAEDVRQDEQKQPLLERSLDHLHDYLKKDQTKNLKHTASQLMIDKLQKQLDRIRLANAKDVTSGLLARWGFDDPKKLGYESRRRYHGKPSGPGVRWFRDRQRGGVIAFDGSGAHLKLPANPQAGHTAGSWAFWMKVDNVPAGYGGQFYIQETCIWIALSGGGVGIDMSNGSGWFDRNGGQATGAIAGKGRITPNTWHHIAFTWDGKTLRGYHNGAASFTTQTVGPKARAQVSKLGPGTRSAMGSRVTSKRFDLKGLMDEFRIYNRALSGKEVMAIVRATRPGRGR
ncbi:MAG: LamG domain-containing protein, partial [Phycisphaeraceae bacterium]|nr:LamG domain-containing protein [Phycisphaeraceae bacterium]